jgi:hypothetical protein
LLAYKDATSQQVAEKIRSEFWKLFDTKSGYQKLDERKQLTLLKISELLLVLEHPESSLYPTFRTLNCHKRLLRKLINKRGVKNYLWLKNQSSTQELTIEELEIKTTPTCISSYLR